MMEVETFQPAEMSSDIIPVFEGLCYADVEFDDSCWIRKVEG